MDELGCISAREVARHIAERAWSPVEVLDAYLRRIDLIEPHVNAFATLDRDGAYASARAAEAIAGDPDAPPFLGVPIGIKDLHATRGLRTTYGSQSLDANVPDYDDEDVARIRRAGFVIVGKTNTNELGTEPITESHLLGPCRNPWAPDRTPGGSSGGSAAAVASGMLPVAHGSDAGGSLRIPAACCGLVGLKPARGRITNAPTRGEWVGGLGTSGPIGRHVGDVATLLDVMRGPATGDPYWAPQPDASYASHVGQPPGPLRVGLLLTSPIATVDPEIEQAVKATARMLEGLGHAVEPLELTVTRELFRDFATLWTAHVASLDVPASAMDPFNRGLAEMGARHSAADLLRAVGGLQRVSRRVVEASAAFDVVLSPTLASLPVEVGAWEPLEPRARFAAGGQFASFPPLANITGQPAMSIPVGWSEEGLPIGAMLTGRPADEATLFRLASQLEEAIGWTHWGLAGPALPAQHDTEDRT